jgi:hypothetical protein
MAWLFAVLSLHQAVLMVSNDCADLRFQHGVVRDEIVVACASFRGTFEIGYVAAIPIWTSIGVAANCFCSSHCFCIVSKAFAS